MRLFLSRWFLSLLVIGCFLTRINEAQADRVCVKVSSRLIKNGTKVKSSVKQKIAGDSELCPKGYIELINSSALQGPKGADGANGVDGNDGVIRSFYFEGTSGTLSTIDSFPAGCQSSLYTAGTNEVALVTANLSNSYTVLNTIHAYVAYSKDGASFTAANSNESSQTIPINNWGSLTVPARISLQPGSTYVFGLGAFAGVNTAPFTSTCKGVVLIVKE